MCTCSDEDDDDDYSKGINTYLQQATARRKSRLSHSGPFSVNHVGPENRVIAACTFDRKYNMPRNPSSPRMGCCMRKTWLISISKHTFELIFSELN